MGFPDSSVGNESACNARDPGSIPGLGRSAGEGIGYPFQYCWASLVAQLVKNLPATWETWVWSLGRKIPWRREMILTTVFWPGEFHGLNSPRGLKESDTSKQLSLLLLLYIANMGSYFKVWWKIIEQIAIHWSFNKYLWTQVYGHIFCFKNAL